jgi:DNA polymerase-3 subunit delta'
MSSLSPIIGHEPQRDALLRDLKTGNVAHAYLFTGPKSLGKFTVAKWFSELLLTAEAKDTESERLIRDQVRKLIHPDLLVIDRLWMEEQQEDLEELARYSNIPQEHRKKSHARTDTISIDDIRLLQGRLQEVSLGKYRCCLMRSMERMQDEAVNALLKILEEPPQGVVFLLTTESPQLLLPTLISRARVLHFQRVSTAELRPLLAESDTDDAAFIAHLAQGAPGVVKRLQEDPEELRKERTLHGLAQSFWHSRSTAERLKILTPLHERAPEAERMLQHLCLTLREDLERQSPKSAASLVELIRGLDSNASRQLLVQRFALTIDERKKVFK